MSTVTVVIPAYNAAATIGRALDSVLVQTWTELEAIVVDDGSTDDTKQVVDSYPASVRCIPQANGGVSRARNEGIAQANGKYVALLDADDYWVPSKIERQVGILDRHPEVGLCSTGAVRVDGDLQPVGRTRARSSSDLCEALLMSSMIAGPVSSLMFRTDLIHGAGAFDPDFSQCADWDFMIRMAQATQITPIDEPLVYYRTGAGRMSSDIELLEGDTFAVLDKFFRRADSTRYAPKKPRIYSNHWMILAGSYLEAGSRRDALRCLRKGLRADPWNLKAPAGLPFRRLKRKVRNRR